VKEGAAGHDENLNEYRLESGVSVQWMIPEAILPMAFYLNRQEKTEL